MPYARDPEKLARTWAVPGMAGYEHRIGGLEKDELKGSVSHDPQNHEKMVNLREEKVQKVEDYIPKQTVDGDEEGELLVVGWGGTFGHLYTALEQLQEEGNKVALAHFSYIHPLPRNSHEILKRFSRVVVCELNLGQFAYHLRSQFPDIEFLQYNKLEGLPFTVQELKQHFQKLMEA